MSICDLLIIFSDQLGNNNNQHIQKLEFEADTNQQSVLNEFVQKYVFSPTLEGKRFFFKLIWFFFFFNLFFFNYYFDLIKFFLF